MRVLAYLVPFTVALATACAGPATARSEDGGPVPFSQLTQTVLDSARADGASDGQIALLEKAVDTGVVSVQDMQEAMEAENDCLIAAGLTTPGVSTDDSTIPTTVTIAYIRAPESMSQDTLGELIDACDQREASGVSLLYSQQPSAQEQYWEAATRQMARIRQCLIDNGVPASDVGDDIHAVMLTAVTLTLADPNLNPYGVHDCISPLSMPLWN